MSLLFTRLLLHRRRVRVVRGRGGVRQKVRRRHPLEAAVGVVLHLVAVAAAQVAHGGRALQRRPLPASHHDARAQHRVGDGAGQGQGCGRHGPAH